MFAFLDRIIFGETRGKDGKQEASPKENQSEATLDKNANSAVTS